jgi:hypothetical protein
LIGCEQAMVFGGTGVRVVGTTPGGALSASWVGLVVADGDDVLTPRSAASPVTGTPLLVLTQADTKTAARHSGTNVVHRRGFINP